MPTLAEMDKQMTLRALRVATTHLAIAAALLDGVTAGDAAQELMDRAATLLTEVENGPA